MQIGERHLLHKGEPVREILLRFAGEAEDQVAAEVDPRNFFAGDAGEFRIILAAVVAVHRLQNPVAAVLQREMQKTADFRFGGHHLQQADVVRMGFGRTQPDPEISVDPAHLAHQRAEVAPRVEVSAGVHPGQHQLRVARRHRLTAVGQHFVEAARPFRAARIRYDAVGTEVVASLLNLQECPAAERKTRNRLLVKRLDRLIQAGGFAAELMPAGQIVEDQFADAALFRIRQYHACRAVFQIGVPVQFGAAPGHHDQRPRVGGPEFADRLAALACRLGGHGTTVHHDQIDRIGGLHHRVTGLLQPVHQQRAVRAVQAAAERM